MPHQTNESNAEQIRLQDEPPVALFRGPQAEYPYGPIIESEPETRRQAAEYELLDTGIFDQDRYFDVFVEAEPEDIPIQITVCNRGPKPADIHVLPTLGFRNTWSWGRKEEKPELKILAAGADVRAVAARHRHIGERSLYCEGVPDLLFTEKRNQYPAGLRSPQSAAVL